MGSDRYEVLRNGAIIFSSNTYASSLVQASNSAKTYNQYIIVHDNVTNKNMTVVPDNTEYQPNSNLSDSHKLLDSIIAEYEEKARVATCKLEDVCRKHNNLLEILHNITDTVDEIGGKADSLKRSMINEWNKHKEIHP